MNMAFWVLTCLALAHLSIINFTANTIQNIHMIMEQHMWSYIDCWYCFWRSVPHTTDNESALDLSEGSQSLQTAHWTEAACEIVAISIEKHPVLINEDLRYHYSDLYSTAWQKNSVSCPIISILSISSTNMLVKQIFSPIIEAKDGVLTVLIVM